MLNFARKIVLPFLLILAPLAVFAQTAANDPVLTVLSDELGREFTALKTQDPPPYYISYNVGDEDKVEMSASYGSLMKSDSSKQRMLLVDLRVGDYHLDNTHEIRSSGDAFGRSGAKVIPFEDNPLAIKLALWHETDKSYKSAQQRLEEVKTNKTVKVAEEDTSGDFSKADASDTYYESPISMATYFPNRKEWEDRLKKCSALFAGKSNIFEAKATLTASIVRKYFVSTEGAGIASNELYIRVMVFASTKAEDGMDLPLYKSYFAHKPSDLPPEDTIENDVRQMLVTLEAMRTAPIVDPYTGPAILSGGAAGVFFHEIFGHRVEGHRQKGSEEGQTFTKKVGQKILPDFLSVYFDPNQQKYRGTDLLGCYTYDDEGVRGHRVDVVRSGVLQGFLMSRSPIAGFSHSNGHARAEPGNRPVARQSNLVVLASKTVPMDSLRLLLIAECKRESKPYGLWFRQVEGGFTLTGRTIPNAFNVLPILVYRVYADGRPDELVRGVDLIGTPLATFERILAAGDDGETFNGICGAESGWVPVSASSPSLLVGQIEVQKKEKSQERLPILKAPDERGN